MAVGNTFITYDSIGVGAFSGSHFKALNEEKRVNIQYDKFNAGGAMKARATAVARRTGSRCLPKVGSSSSSKLRAS